MKIQRYSFVEEDQGLSEYKDDWGEWVKWVDVESLLKAYLALNHKMLEIKKAVSDTIFVKGD